MSIKLRVKKNNNILNYNSTSWYFWNIGLIHFIKNSKLIISYLKKKTKKNITFNLKQKLNTKINLHTNFKYINEYRYNDFCILKNICSYNIRSFKYYKNYFNWKALCFFVSEFLYDSGLLKWKSKK